MIRFRCAKCLEDNSVTLELETEERLESHIRTSHLKWKPYQCGDCQWSSSDLKILRKHQSLAHKDSSTTVAHFVCDEEKSLLVSSITVQSIRLADSDSELVISCAQCQEWNPEDSPVFGSLSGHFRQHLDYRPFSCVDCSIKSSTIIALRNHIKNKHPDGQKKILLNFDEKLEAKVEKMMEGAIKTVKNMGWTAYESAMEAISGGSKNRKRSLESDGSPETGRKSRKPQMKNQIFFDELDNPDFETEDIEYDEIMKSVFPDDTDPDSSLEVLEEVFTGSNPEDEADEEMKEVEEEEKEEAEEQACTLCNAMVRGDEQKNHAWKMHLGNPSALSCSVCGFSKFGMDLQSLKHHIRQRHPTNSEEDIVDEREKYESKLVQVTSVCFPNGDQSELEDEKSKSKQDEDNPNRKRCALCKMEVALKVDAERNHVWKHHLNNPPGFSCHRCPFTVGYKRQDLRSHYENTHNSSDLSDAIDLRGMNFDKAEEQRLTCFPRIGVEKSPKPSGEKNPSEPKDRSIPAKQCGICKRAVAVSDSNSLIRHAWTKHMGNPQALACPLCPKTLSLSVAGIKKHMFTEHDGATKFTDEREKYQEQLESTLKQCFSDADEDGSSTQNEESEYFPTQMCQLCEREVNIEHGITSMRDHAWKIHLENPVVWFCPTCPFATSGSKKSVQTHLKIVHKLENVDVIDNRDQFTEQLNQTLFQCFGLVEGERVVRTGEEGLKSRECTMCHAQILVTSKECLKKHVWRTHLGNPMTIKCKYCDFTTDFYLVTIKEHMRKRHPGKNEMDFIEEDTGQMEECRALTATCFPTEKKRRTLNENLAGIDCALCAEKVLDNSTSKKRHVWQVHLGDPQTAKCTHCSYTIGFNHSYLQRHLADRHKLHEPHNIPDGRGKHMKALNKMLPLCFGKSSSRKSKEPTQTTDSKPKTDTRCSKCQISVSSSETAKEEHVWTEHMSKVKALQCNLCSLALGNQEKLMVQHIQRIHGLTNKAEISKKFTDKRGEFRNECRALMKICFVK